MLRMGLPWMRSKPWWMQGRYCIALLHIFCIIAIQYKLCLQSGKFEILSSAQYQRQPESESHAGVVMGKYEHAMDTIHASVQGSPVALLRSENSRCAVGWLVVCTVGCWTVESGAKRLANGFFNSAEQPFAKACGTTVLLSWGLQRAAHSDRWREAADTQPPPPSHTKHIHTLSLHILFLVRECGWFPS